MNFITYFDKNYVVKGWCCYKSLYKFLEKDLKFYVLCLDQDVYEQAKNFKQAIPIKLKEIEKTFPDLLSVKNTRSLKEYYATITPILPFYVFDIYKEDLLTYTDADIFYYSNPLKILDILGANSLLVTYHGFDLDNPRAGIHFNVGILCYRNTDYCRNFLYWLKNKCYERCDWRETQGEQLYLNILHDQPNTFKNVIKINPIQTGINLAPWNGSMCYITDGNPPKINGQTDLIAYHFHELQKINSNEFYPTGWQLNSGFIEYIYKPYYTLYNETEKELYG